MATTTTSVTYVITVTSSVEGEISTSSLTGITDTDALNMATALKNFVWPSVLGTITVTGYKYMDSNTQYTANLAASPPVFS